jgi:hypothetical protein
MTQYSTIGTHSFRRLHSATDSAFLRDDIFDYNYVAYNLSRNES